MVMCSFSCFLGSLSTNESRNVDQLDGDVIAAGNDLGSSGGSAEDVAVKRHSLRSTSSFCDEVFLEELAAMCLGAGGGSGGGGPDSIDGDAVSYGALSLGGLSDGCINGTASSASHTMTAVNSIVGFDDGNLNSSRKHMYIHIDKFIVSDFFNYYIR